MVNNEIKQTQLELIKDYLKVGDILVPASYRIMYRIDSRKEIEVGLNYAKTFDDKVFVYRKRKENKVYVKVAWLKYTILGFMAEFENE